MAGVDHDDPFVRPVGGASGQGQNQDGQERYDLPHHRWSYGIELTIAHDMERRAFRLFWTMVPSFLVHPGACGPAAMVNASSTASFRGLEPCAECPAARYAMLARLPFGVCVDKV
jgi:hypothetical protein